MTNALRYTYSCGCAVKIAATERRMTTVRALTQDVSMGMTTTFESQCLNVPSPCNGICQLGEATVMTAPRMMVKDARLDDAVNTFMAIALTCSCGNEVKRAATKRQTIDVEATDEGGDNGHARHKVNCGRCRGWETATPWCREGGRETTSVH